jgi:hypothetical protein
MKFYKMKVHKTFNTASLFAGVYPINRAFKNIVSIPVVISEK